MTTAKREKGSHMKPTRKKLDEVEKIVHAKGPLPDDYPKWLRRKLQALVREAITYGEELQYYRNGEDSMVPQKKAEIKEKFGIQVKP